MLVDQSLKEADHVGPLTIVATAGQTPGCLSFYWLEAGWAGLTLDMKQNVQSVGKLSDFGDAEIVGIGHPEPSPQGGIEVLKKLRNQKV